MTDDPYGDVDPIAWFNRRLYVPDLAVGRLVETHDEIAATVQAYLDPNGDTVLDDTGIMPATSTYMTGYDFMADGAIATRDALNAALTEAGGGAPTSTSNISPPDAMVTKTQVLAGASSARSVGLFGHFSHNSSLTDQGFRSGNGENFTSAELAGQLRPVGAPANARLVFSIGCHSGLNVTDGPANSADFAQQVLGTGAVYVATTAYGYGAAGTVGMNEALMTSFAEQLDGSYVLIDRNAADAPANRRYLSIGEAFVAAKQQYFSSQGLYGPYDEKALEAAIFYGLPMFRVGQSGTQQTAPAADVPSAVGGAAYTAVDQSHTFNPAAVTGANGTYYTVAGFDPQVTANRPVQPRFETDVTAVDGSGGVLYAKGVLITNLETLSANTVNPVVTRPILDSAANEPELGVGDIAYPSLPASITTYSDPLGFEGDNTLLQRQKLVIVPGQFLDNATVDAAGDGTQVLYGRVDTRVTYSDSGDWDRPTVTSAVGTIDGGNASFTVAATDGSGIQRVLVLYRTDTADWTPLDLTFGGSMWEGGASVGAATSFDYLVQVVDNNGNIATSTGKGRGLQPFVAPVPDPAIVSVVAGSAPEGDTGSSARSMSITLDRPAPGAITVDYVVAAGSATAGTDYTASNGSATFQPGDLVANVPIDVIGDTATEAPESMSVTLTTVAGAGSLGQTSAQFTIVDDDAAAPPATLITAADPSPVLEGNAGTQTVNVPITLSPTASGSVQLSWSILNTGTATMGSDVAAPFSGTVTVPANTGAAVIPISVAGDTTDEADETVVVQISSTTAGVSVVDGTAVITITDDDEAAPLPTVSIADVTVDEAAGTASAIVTLSAASSSQVSVPWSTEDGSATSLDDYTDSSGTLIITSGLTGTITVAIEDDIDAEPTEAFTIALGTPTGATVADGTAIVTITDDDTVAPTPSVLTIGPVTVTEGTGAAPTSASVPITISPATVDTVTVAYSLSPGTAAAGSDYAATSGTVTIAAGATSASVPVSIVADALDEANTETFVVTLGAVTGTAVVGTPNSATVTITDDDVTTPPTGPQLSVSDVSILEASSGTRTARIRVSISPTRTSSTRFTWRTQNGTASSPGDYTSVSPRFATISAGATGVWLDVVVRGDTLNENNETVNVIVSAPPAGVGLADPTGVVTIVDDDPRPVVNIANASVVEGHSGTRSMTFTVTLSSPTGDSVSVGWITADGTARTSNNDYRAANGTLTFSPGQTSRTVTVTVVGDRRDESNETLLVRLRSPVLVTLGRSTATGTIVDDD